MKLTRGKKAAMICFAAFLVFMAVCTVAAKGIYASGLPRITTVKPYSGSLARVITVNGTVMQGQEYGVYVEPGLRVDTISVNNGDTFQAGQKLFRIETGDLAGLIAQRHLEISRLEVQMEAAVKEDSSARQVRKRAADRAREDYERAAVLADAKIQECQQAYEAAQRALALYDQYLADAARAENQGEETEPPDGAGNEGSGDAPGAGNDVSGGTPGNGNYGNEDTPGDGNSGNDDISGNVDVSTVPADGNMGSSIVISAGMTGDENETDRIGRLQELSSEGMDPEKQYSRQEKRFQLEQGVISAAQALEEEIRRKEDTLREAARVLEDADAALDSPNAEVNTLALDIAYQKETVQELEKLLEADGWVYAQDPGRVTRSSLEVGGRTQDGASLVYARDDGQRILSAVFSEEQSGHVSVGTLFEMKAAMPDGSRLTGTAVLEYLEKGADGLTRARFSFELEGMTIGQSAELSCRLQTDTYSTCISRNCLYQEGEDSYYVYILQESEGILGTEWKVRKAGVRILDQNDTAAALQSAEITGDTLVVSGTDKPLTDGAAVRAVQ